MTDKIIFDTNNNHPQNDPQEVLAKEKEVVMEKTVKAEEVLSPPIVELVERYRQSLILSKKEISAIHVDEIASKIAFLYERIRKIIDWKEENVLRRSAILRILKRHFISKITVINFNLKLDINSVAENLTLELIRGGHLQNDEVPKEKIGGVAQVLKKYIYLLENAPYNKSGEIIFKKKVNFYNFILEVAACEIEDVLAPPVKENALIRAMTHLMTERIRLVPENALTPLEKETQTYIATCRTLFDLDDAIITYHILKYRYPQWLSPTNDFIIQFTNQVFLIFEKIDKDLNHPLRKELLSYCERTDTVFTLLDDLLDYYKKEPDKITQVLANKAKLKELLTQFYDKRYKTLKTRLFRLAIVTAFSVFFSNWFTFFIIEVPLAHLFYEGFNLFAAVIDFLVPPALMFLMVVIIKPPPASNLDKVIELVYRFVYLGEKKDLYEIKVQKKKRPIISFVIFLLYLAAAIVSFGTIARIFYLARLPITSVIFDTATIALNIFAALVIRNKAKELTVDDKSSIWEFILDVLSVPVAKIGSFLAAKWREYNVFTVFLNVFVELPFVTFIDFMESWSQFLKEKKAEFH